MFAGRYKSLLIDESSPLYLRAVCDYVHLNPARAGMIKPEAPLQSYRWSSYASYLGRARYRAGWRRCDRLLEEHGFVKETRRSRLELSRRVEALRLEKRGKNEEEIRKGWLYGGDDFLARLIDRFEKSAGESHRALERNQTDEEIAERIVRAGLKELGWKEADLRQRRKGDEGKVRLARDVRKRTAMSLEWIARRLGRGSWTNVSNLLRKETIKSEDLSERRRQVVGDVILRQEVEAGSHFSRATL